MMLSASGALIAFGKRHRCRAGYRRVLLAIQPPIQCVGSHWRTSSDACHARNREGNRQKMTQAAAGIPLCGSLLSAHVGCDISFYRSKFRF